MKKKQLVKIKEKIPQSRKKALDYFNDVTDKQGFKDAVWEIRMKYTPNRIGMPRELGDDSDSDPSFYPLHIDGDYYLDDKTEEIEKEIEEKILKKYALSKYLQHQNYPISSKQKPPTQAVKMLWWVGWGSNPRQAA